MIRSASLSLSLSIWFSSIRTARRIISQGSPRQPRAVSIRLDTQRRAVTAVLKGRGEQSAGDHAISELADNRGDKARRKRLDSVLPLPCTVPACTVPSIDLSHAETHILRGPSLVAGEPARKQARSREGQESITR
jgi:hypothetical protein